MANCKNQSKITAIPFFLSIAKNKTMHPYHIELVFVTLYKEQPGERMCLPWRRLWKNA